MTPAQWIGSMRALALACAAMATPAWAEPAVADPDPTVESTALTPAQAYEDFDLAVAAVEAALPDLYWHQSRRQWRRAKTAARAQLADADDSADLYRQLRPLLSQVGEGHMSLQRTAAMKRSERAATRMLPIDIHWNEAVGADPARRDETRAYVIAGYGDAATIAPGTRLLAIDGEPVTKLIEELTGALGRDGRNLTAAMREGEGRGYAQVRNRMRDAQASYRLGLMSADGRVEERVVDAIAYDARPTPADEQTSPVATLEWLDARTAYMSVPSFSNKAYKRAGADFHGTIQGLFDQLRQRGARDLILDLRRNGGGSEPNESILYSYLMQAPLHKYAAVEARAARLDVTSASGKRFAMQVFDEEELSQQRALGNGRYTRLNRPPEGLMTHWTVSAPVYRGRLVVLVGGRTFSGGAELASMLQHVRRGVLVGEEVGGAHHGNTSGYEWRIELPNSRMTLLVPLLQFRMNWPALPSGGGVRPACAVPPEVAELDVTRDRAWRTAVALLGQSWRRPQQARCPP